MSTSRQSAAAAPALAPLDGAARINLLDALRGFALAGILLMNIEWFGRSILALPGFDTSLTGLDHATGWLVRCFVEGKFYKLFALLFGMGFAIMLTRAEQQQRPWRAWCFRRVVGLLAIGIVHYVFIWNGDVLADYASAALLFMFLLALLRTPWLKRFDNPCALLKISLAWLCAPLLVGILTMLAAGLRFDYAELEQSWQQTLEFRAEVVQRLDAGASQDATAAASAEREALIRDVVAGELAYREAMETEERILAQGSFAEATRLRARDYLDSLGYKPYYWLGVLMPLFLLGYWLVRSGIIARHAEFGHVFRPMAWSGWILGLALSIAGLIITQHPAARAVTALDTIGRGLFSVSQYLLAAGYLASFVLLYRHIRWQRWLDLFAPLGRLALTNYLAQSLILALLFYGYGFGLYGEVSRTAQIPLALAIVAVQLLYSRWWLARFRFGPVEWLWRSLTYLSIQPMQRRARVGDLHGEQGTA